MNKERTIFRLNKTDNDYWPKSDKKDDVLLTAWFLLDESKSFLNDIKKATLLLESHGQHAANATAVIFKRNNNIVFIQPLYGDDAEDYRVEMTREGLLKLINDRQALVAQHPYEIIMTRDEQGKITLEGIFNH